MIPSENDQLELYDVEGVVEDVGFYHGGDELYKLKGVPGVWHEHCLREVEGSGTYLRRRVRE
jgi:hypothetical protein